jgi:asparagine synthase (glutamine-hydrolysing)
MCGIAGIVRPNKDQRSEIGDQRSGLDHAVVERMVAALGHRGPDDRGISDFGSRHLNLEGNGKTACVQQADVSLGHTRLSIIDLSPAGHQPKTTQDGRYSIVYNGEIYNYRELRKQLVAEGATFRSETDTEVVLQLYAKHGENCLQMLEGMFAFAVRDNKTGELFAARDRLGIKPLYYYRRRRAEGNCFLFASEIRALLASGLVPRVLDPISVNSYLSFGAVQEPRTILRDVRTLPPAHFLRVDGDGAIREIKRYWHLPETNKQVTRAEALAETRRRFERSVESHLVADVPLGAFLSGGIDSSAIVAMMSKHAPQRVRTFNVCFKESEFSERAMAGLVAEKWGTAHTEVFLSEHELLESLPAALANIEQPTIDGINTWAISKAVREAGITVALSGLGGDELFGGYPSFDRVPAMIRYLKYFSVFGTSAPKQFAALATKMMNDSLPSQKIAAAVSGNRDTLSVYAAARGLFSKNSRRGLTDGNGLIKSDYDLPDETLELLKQANGNGDIFNTISKLELNLYMANMLLRDTDAMSMAHSLEVRVPFLDHRLVEWVYALPGEMKSGHGPKPFFVEALGADLIPEVANRKKMGFALPFEKWLRGSLEGFVNDVLRDRTAVERAGLDHQQVLDNWERFLRNHKSTSWSRIWSLVVLVNWCGQHEVTAVE